MTLTSVKGCVEVKMLPQLVCPSFDVKGNRAPTTINEERALGQGA
jgi:hypothetical protein